MKNNPNLFNCFAVICGVLLSGAATLLGGGENLAQNPEFAAGSKGYKYWTCKLDRQTSRVADGTGSCVFVYNGKDKVGHVEQRITLNQQEATPIQISVWSKAENTAATPAAGYEVSLRCDVVYFEGKTDYVVAPVFPAGNYDWQERKILLAPSKPIKQINIYGRCNNFSGSVWFDSLKVEAVPELFPSSNLVKNHCFTKLLSSWKLWNCAFDPTESRVADGSGSCKFDYKDNSRPGHVEQTVELNQTQAEPIAVSVWCKTDIPDAWGMDRKNFALNTCVIFTDGTKSWKNRVAIPAGKSDWKQYQLLIPASKPVKSVIIYGRYANHRGQVWFDDFVVETVDSKKKSNVAQ